MRKGETRSRPAVDSTGSHRLQYAWELVAALVVLAFLLSGCPRWGSRPMTWDSHRSVDVVLVPGCPSQADGQLSRCQWERVVWAAQLWEDGVAESFITSGAAVHTPYVEAEALAAGLMALGVPSDRIQLETQALHSDENGAYAMDLIEAAGHETVGVASHTGHANTIKLLMRAWGQQSVVSLELNWVWVQRRLRRGLPDVSTEPVPDGQWLPMRELERLQAGRVDRSRRLPSLLNYPWVALQGVFGRPSRPIPPQVEPTLRSRSPTTFNDRRTRTPRQ